MPKPCPSGQHLLLRPSQPHTMPVVLAVIVAISYANTEHSIFVLLHGDERCQIRREICSSGCLAKLQGPQARPPNNEGANISERLIESEGTGPAVAAAAPVSTRGRVQTERITSVPAAAARRQSESWKSIPDFLWRVRGE
ncbi:unnamed protein product [Leuciscus chuanchicus]